jgi:hypothetical protein
VLGVLLLGVDMPEERLVAAVLAEYVGWQVRKGVSQSVLPDFSVGCAAVD